MKYLLIFIIVCYATGFAFAQTNNAKVSDLKNNLKRLEKVSQELKNRTIVVQVDLPAKLTTPRRFILTTLRRCNLTTHF